MIPEGWEFWHWVASGILFIPNPLPLSLPPHSTQGRGAWGGMGQALEEHLHTTWEVSPSLLSASSPSERVLNPAP